MSDETKNAYDQFIDELSQPGCSIDKLNRHFAELNATLKKIEGHLDKIADMTAGAYDEARTANWHAENRR